MREFRPKRLWRGIQCLIGAVLLTMLFLFHVMVMATGTVGDSIIGIIVAVLAVFFLQTTVVVVLDPTNAYRLDKSGFHILSTESIITIPYHAIGLVAFSRITRRIGHITLGDPGAAFETSSRARTLKSWVYLINLMVFFVVSSILFLRWTRLRYVPVLLRADLQETLNLNRKVAGFHLVLMDYNAECRMDDFVHLLRAWVDYDRRQRGDQNAIPQAPD